jgi:hypothetical protein
VLGGVFGLALGDVLGDSLGLAIGEALGKELGLELGDALGLALGSTGRESVAIVDGDGDDSRFLDACDGWRCLLSSIFQKKHFWYKFPVVSSVGWI